MDIHNRELPTVPTRKATIDCTGSGGEEWSLPAASHYRQV